MNYRGTAKGELTCSMSFSSSCRVDSGSCTNDHLSPLRLSGNFSGAPRSKVNNELALSLNRLSFL